MISIFSSHKDKNSKVEKLTIKQMNEELKNFDKEKHRTSKKI